MIIAFFSQITRFFVNFKQIMILHDTHFKLIFYMNHYISFAKTIIVHLLLRTQFFLLEDDLWIWRSSGPGG